MAKLPFPKSLTSYLVLMLVSSNISLASAAEPVANSNASPAPATPAAASGTPAGNNTPAPTAGATESTSAPAAVAPPVSCKAPEGMRSVLDTFLYGMVTVVEKLTLDPAFAAKLKVTPDQVSKLKPIVEKANKDGAAFMEKGSAVDRELQVELETNPKPGKAKIATLIKKEMDIRSAMADASLNTFSDVIGVISMDQLRQAFEQSGAAEPKATTDSKSPAAGSAPMKDSGKGGESK